VIAEQGMMQNQREVKIEGKTLEGKKMIIATGCASVVPDIPGMGEAAMSIDEMLGMTRVPDSILIYGAEAMEVEMAVIMNTFGAKVYLATGGVGFYPRKTAIQASGSQRPCGNRE
jgi:pyruvate/2-oxoglutarate dehydrogenase complex dihydrolipoamide dehydrogenase (E3) component